ncbi:MAG: hypothetical protein L6R40_002443 [Gallowayella cf. fulva]|nr:MAG: hypothetical protein L6R40_002443 [Xanthomendoza cf. fulva]
MTQTVNLSLLGRADGSASYTSNGSSVLATVNGPVEVQRRDEIPEEAAIDVVLRPAIAVGGVRERHLESIIEKTLRQVILVSAHPRTLIQITLQVTATQAESATSTGFHQSASNLPLLPALLQSSILALLSTSLPLTVTLTSTLIAVSRSGELVAEPSAKALKEAASLHVLGFSSHGELLVAESEGTFDIDTWDQVYVKAEQVCRGSSTRGEKQSDESNMDLSKPNCLEDSLRNVMEEKAAREQRWKDG